MTRSFPRNDEEWGMRPYFLWDYDISWRDFEKALRSPSSFRREWSWQRLLTSANWNDIWNLVSVDEIASMLPELPRLRDASFWTVVVDVARTR